MKKYSFLYMLLAGIMFFNSCKKEDDNFTSASINDYYPLQVGKYINYNLDSLIFINFNTKDTTIKYLAQDVVDAKITDNNGRPAYRIIRYLRKDNTQAWQPDNTFMAIPSDNSLEFVEDNLRFIKLKIPFTEGYTWLGNSYLPPDPYSIYDFGSAFMDGWQYEYQDVNKPLTLGALTFDSTITVTEINDSIGDPNVAGTAYAEKTYSIEKYAKGIGLIYKEFLHWEYQANDKSYKGFGIKLTITGHN